MSRPCHRQTSPSPLLPWCPSAARCACFWPPAMHKNQSGKIFALLVSCISFLPLIKQQVKSILFIPIQKVNVREQRANRKVPTNTSTQAAIRLALTGCRLKVNCGHTCRHLVFSQTHTSGPRLLIDSILHPHTITLHSWQETSTWRQISHDVNGCSVCVVDGDKVISTNVKILCTSLWTLFAWYSLNRIEIVLSSRPPLWLLASGRRTQIIKMRSIITLKGTRPLYSG